MRLEPGRAGVRRFIDFLTLPHYSSDRDNETRPHPHYSDKPGRKGGTSDGHLDLCKSALRY